MSAPAFKLPRMLEAGEPPEARGMRRDDIQDVLDRLTDPSGAHVVFAVQGGVFSEGVDYPGHMAIGAFVSVKLPPSSLIFKAVFQAIEFSSRARVNLSAAFPPRKSHTR